MFLASPLGACSAGCPYRRIHGGTTNSCGTAKRRNTPPLRALTRTALTGVESAAVRRLELEQPRVSKEMPALLDLLRTAGMSKGVEPELVEGALLRLESMASAAGRPIRDGGARVDGRWRLVFSTATKLRFFQYIPVVEDLNIELEARRIALESAVGPFSFLIKGDIASFDDASGKMEFAFKTVDVMLGGNRIWQKVIDPPRPKTYEYYYMGPDVGGARSSAGGVSLLVKNA